MRTLSVFVVASMLLLSACGKVNLENYGKIKRGMETAEVEAIIGSPTSCNETLGVRTCTWGDEQKNISVTYGGSKVINMGHAGLN